MATIRQTILTILGDGPRTTNQILDAANRASPSVRAVLYQLRNAGIIEASREGNDLQTTWTLKPLP